MPRRGSLSSRYFLKTLQCSTRSLSTPRSSAGRWRSAVCPIRWPRADSALLTLDLQAATADYIIGQARLLALPTQRVPSELHMVKPHQPLLELPGIGGQLAHHIVSTQPGLANQEACSYSSARRSTMARCARIPILI